MDTESSSALRFEEYLNSKKIDPAKFKKAEEDQFTVLKTLFDQIHPNSFTQQKLFLINKIRRKYILEEERVTPGVVPTKKLKPKILHKPKLS